MNTLDISLDPVKVPGILSAKVWINGGSKNDPNMQRGAHQLLGAVLSRGCGPYSNNNVAELVEGCGAGLRCDTYEDGLLISLKCSDSDTNRLLELVGWMITSPHLKSEQIKLERELSLQALQRQKENPFQLCFDGWRQLAYANGPYGHDPLGTVEDVEVLTGKELSPLAKNMTKGRKIMAIAGTFSSDIEKQIMNMKPFNLLADKEESQSSLLATKFDDLLPKKRNSNLYLQPERTGQVVIMLGQPTIPHGHKNDLALRLLGCHLGSGMSSILFRELREKHGVAYDVGIHHPIRGGPSPFVIHVSTSEEKAFTTLQILKEIWENLKTKYLSNEELQLSRAKFRGHIAHGSQTVGQRAERRAQLRWLNLGDDYDFQSLRDIEHITSQELQTIAINHLMSPLLSLCGPEKTINKISKSWQSGI